MIVASRPMHEQILGACAYQRQQLNYMNGELWDSFIFKPQLLASSRSFSIA